MVRALILSIQYPERYAIRRLVTVAQQELLAQYPGLHELEIVELSEPGQINRYAQVLVLPSLVIEERLVCSGRYPSKEEVAGWLMDALESKARKET